MAARLAAVAVTLIQPITGWQNVARCVSGKTILDHPLFGSNGTLSSYAEGLQTLVPAYGDMVEIAVSEDELNCTAAANGINGNHVLVDDAAAAYYMDVVRTKGQNKLAEEDKYYFFAFDSTHFHEYEYMATCIPGGVVGFDVLNITKGAIGAYTVVLQALMHNYGDLMYLGKSDTAAECFVPQDKLNSGNSTALQGLKKKQYNVSEVSMFGSVGTGDPNKTYLFVFTNKDWNASWGMFGQPIISGAQKDYWAQTTTKPPSARRRRTVSLFSLGSRRRKSGGKGKDDDDDKKEAKHDKKEGKKDADDDKKEGKEDADDDKKEAKHDKKEGEKDADDDKKEGKKEVTDRRLKTSVFI